MKKTVLFILSSNFSGSHYLSLLMGSHSCATHLGEVKNLVKKKRGEAYSEKSVESTRYCYLCGKDKECILFRGLREADYRDLYPKLFNRLPPTVVVLVDTSKKVRWAKQFLGQSEYDVKFLHLIRDPRALVRKWGLHYQTPKSRLKQRIKQCKRFPLKTFMTLASAQWRIYILKWVYQNREINKFLSSCGKQHRLLTYHDLVENSENIIVSIMQWLGLTYEMGQLRYWEHDHHGTQKPNYDWIKESGSQYFDLRWKEELSDKIQLSIIQHKEVSNLIRELSLDVTPNGLASIDNDISA